MDKHWLSAFVCILFAGFAIGSAAKGSYTPPGKLEVDSSKYTVTINKGYDETWESLMRYSSKTFFGIENYEKASGLLTLSFGANDFHKYIDCGTFKAEIPARNFNYQGPYAKFLEKHSNANLDGKMNIFVESVSDTMTTVRVHARYVVTNKLYNNQGALIGTDQWSFDSGGHDTIKVSNPIRRSQNTRTCKPTYKAENTILNAVRDF